MRRRDERMRIDPMRHGPLVVSVARKPPSVMNPAACRARRPPAGSPEILPLS